MGRFVRGLICDLRQGGYVESDKPLGFELGTSHMFKFCDLLDLGMLVRGMI